MAIEFPCTGCAELFVVAEVTAGRKGKCPKCAVVNVVPQAKPVVAPSTAVFNKVAASRSHSDAAEPSSTATEATTPPVADEAKPQAPRVIPPPPTLRKRRRWMPRAVVQGIAVILLLGLLIGAYILVYRLFGAEPNTEPAIKQAGSR